MADAEQVEDHVDEFFVDLVLLGLARELRLVLAGTGRRRGRQQASPPRSRIEELYLRLTWIFNVSTERSNARSTRASPTRRTRP